MKRLYPLLLLLCLAMFLGAGLADAATVTGPTGPGGVEVQLDLPASLHVKNRGGSDGAGLCVFASIKHSALWSNVEALEHIFEWMFNHPGGGYPDKVDRVIRQICKEKNVPVPPYLQIQGKDLEILKLATKNGLLPAVTYSFSPSGRYGGRRIAHMCSLLHATDIAFVVLDNNMPGTYEWMTPQEFSRAYNAPQGWAVILLDAGPPPPPVN